MLILMRQSDLDIDVAHTSSYLFIISAFAELKIWHLAVVLGTIGGLRWIGYYYQITSSTGQSKTFR